MEWITQLQGKVVGLDTAPLIYFMEQNPNYLDWKKQVASTQLMS